jgi:AraC family transcriptional regulator
VTAATVVTLGSPVAVVHAESFSVAEVTYTPGAEYAQHTHERTYVALALSGRYEEEVGNRADVAESASVVLMPAGTPHANRIADHGARSMVITFEPALRTLTGAEPSEWRIVQGGAAARILLRLYLAFRLSGPAEMATMEELLLEFCDRIILPRLAPAAPRAVGRAMQILRSTDDQSIRPGDVARRLGLDPSYLARAFRRAQGESMGETLRRIRAKRAASLLASTSRPLAEIAFNVGFADQSHFCRVFRSQIGLTPLAYRRLFRS